MTRTIPAAVQSTFETDSFALAVLVKVVRPDGQAITLTTWDQPLSVNLDGDGSLTYSPADITDISQFSAQINAAIDDGQLRVPLDETFVADDIRREFYGRAVVKIGYVIPTDLANPWLHRVYYVGQVDIDGGQVNFELLGPEKALETPVWRPLTANCQWSFGDIATCGLNLNVSAWAATTAYAVGDEVKPTTTSLLWFICTTAGTSGGSEPTWGAGTVNDGTVVWTSFNARKATGTVSSVTDARTFSATGISITNDWFGEGWIEWLTGDNAGERQRVRSDNGTGAIVQHFPCLDAILVGDTFEITAGCRKRVAEDCVTKHQNATHSTTKTLRAMAFPYLAPENVTLSAPKSDS